MCGQYGNGGKERFVSGVKLPTPWRLGVLLFADDMVLMADSAKGLESNLKVMNQLLSRWEGKENRMKTRLMRVARQKGHCQVKKCSFGVHYGTLASQGFA